MKYTCQKKHYVSSKYKGVYKNKNNGYVAKICINGILNISKPFKTEKEASNAYLKLKSKFSKKTLKSKIITKKEKKYTKKKKKINSKHKYESDKFDSNKRIKFPQFYRNKVSSNQKWCCNICKNLLKETIIVDHIVPLSMGGNNNLSNLQSLCAECDKIKTGIIDYQIIKKLKNNNIDSTLILNKQRDYYENNIKKYLNNQKNNNYINIEINILGFNLKIVY